MQKLENKMCFFKAVDPMNEPVELTFSMTSRGSFFTRQIGKIYQNAVDWFDLTVAQDLGKLLWRTVSNAIILCDVMPAESLVQVVLRGSR